MADWYPSHVILDKNDSSDEHRPGTSLVMLLRKLYLVNFLQTSIKRKYFQLTGSMDRISDVSKTSLHESNFIKPFRIRYSQVHNRSSQQFTRRTRELLDMNQLTLGI